MRIEPFPERYRRALADIDLRTTLLQFQRQWRASRDEAIGQIDFEADRLRLAAAKDDVIDHLPDVLEQYVAAAEERGITVELMSSGQEVVTYITELARRQGMTRVVKSKSMTTEEIDLNDGLTEAGLDVTETDLGEWIVQLAGERPSHIVGPALHKNRRQVAELLERVTGRSVSRDDIGEQVGLARDVMREHFLTAEIGISGANALIAETGGIMLVTNEGNAELVTSIPQIHVVVAGIEKLLRTADDALLELRLLSASATGQLASAYVSWITGPGGPDRKMHVLLLDHGRMAIRARAEFRDALRCIRCGACSSVCPSYGVVGGHVFGHIYSGAIGLVNTPFHHGLAQAAGPQSLCVSCNACEAVCPVAIPLPRQILDTRAEVIASEGMPPLYRLTLEIWSRRRVFALAARTASVLQRPVKRGRFLRMPGFSRYTSWRTPPALAAHPFRDRPISRLPEQSDTPVRSTFRGKRVALFTQCLTDWLDPDIASAVVDVLMGLGAEVIIVPNQHCCGLPACDAGMPHIARRMAAQTIEALESVDADWIVTGGASCAIAIQHEYPHLFRDEPAWRERAHRIGARVRDFTSLLEREAKLPAGALVGAPLKATYHFFCQSWNVLGFRDEPIRLLRDVCGIELTSLPEAQTCCGFGGSVSMTRPDVCRHILDRKLSNLDSTGASLLITDNPGCIMHLRGGIDASGRAVEVRHTAEIVSRRLHEMRRH